MIIGPITKKGGTIVTKPILILYTTRKPMSTKPMVILKNNNEMVTKASKAEVEAIENNDTNSGQAKNDNHHDVIKKAVQPNADSQNTLQTICLQEHTQNQLDDVHEDHIEKAAKEKNDEIQRTIYHVSDKNGKKITEITTTKIIEENSDNAASKHQSSEKCNTLDLTDEHSSKKHLSEEKVKDKSVIVINKLLNGTNVSKNLGNKRDVLESLTTNHEINCDSRNLSTYGLDENPHDIKQEDIVHDIDCDTKNQTTHLLEAKLEYIKPRDKKITNEEKECNITQPLEKKDKKTPLSEVMSDNIVKDNHPDITTKLLVDTPKVHLIKLINISPIDLRPHENDTTKRVITDLSIDATKEVPNLPIHKVNALLISNPRKPLVTIAPTRTIFEIVNITDCNTTKANTSNKSKELDIQRMKMSIKVEMNSENKSLPVDSKNILTACVVQNENEANGTYTNVDIKLDDEKNGKFIFIFL